MQKVLLLALMNAVALGQVEVDENGQEVDLGGGSGGGGGDSNQDQNQTPEPQPQDQDGEDGGDSNDGDSNNDENTGDDNAEDDSQDSTPSDQDLQDMVNDFIEEWSDLSEEEKEATFEQFANDDNLEIEFGFNGGEPDCNEQVPEGDESCLNYANLPTMLEDDDIPTMLKLIEYTCGVEQRTPPSSLGPLLCLGAVGSCRASDFGWELPSDNSKGGFKEFFENTNLGQMVQLGQEESRPTLCYAQCREAWEYWAACDNFGLDVNQDPCAGLPESGCYNPDQPETATLAGAGSGGNMISIMGGVMMSSAIILLSMW